VEKIKQCKVFPPTFIVHGDADRMVPTELSRVLFRGLKDLGVECGMVEVPGEDHTFAMGMKVGSQTWEVQRRGFDWLERIIG
jgi:dipeptidyl aminopeptidase/acylaminoacyl peptidase